MLSYRELAEARESRSKKVISKATEMGPEMMKNLPTGVEAKEAVKKADKDPLNEYDIDMILEKGIIGWSYEEKVTPKNIGFLDEETALFVAKALVPKIRSKDEAKKG